MATITDPGYPTLLNLSRRLDPNGMVTQYIADTLTKLMPMIEDIPWVEGNLPTGHQITTVNSLPAPSWRRINQGLDPVKGATDQYTETCGLLEAHSKIDQKAAELGGNVAAYRQSEDKMFLEGMTQEFARALLYENVTVNPERFEGFAPRYPATTGYTTSSYVKLSGTPASSNSYSIWIITWDEERVFGIFPKGSKAGLSYYDRGILPVRDSNSKDFFAYVGQYKWECGLAVKDYRYVTRLQWDSGDAGQTDTAKQLFLSLQNALATHFMVNERTRIYMNRVTRGKLGAQLMSNSQNALMSSVENQRLIERFMGVPIRITDHLVAETALS